VPITVGSVPDSRSGQRIEERGDAVEQRGAADVEDVGMPRTGDLDQRSRGREGVGEALRVGQGTRASFDPCTIKVGTETRGRGQAGGVGLARRPRAPRPAVQ